MKALSVTTWMASAILIGAGLARADAVILYNGQRLEGEIVGETEEEVSLRQASELPGLAYVRKIHRLNIQRVEKGPSVPGSQPATEPAGLAPLAMTAKPVRPEDEKLTLLNSAITKWEQGNYTWAGFLLARLINTSPPGELAYMSAEVDKKLNMSLAELAAQSHFKAAEPAKPGQRIHLPYVTQYERPELLKILKRANEEALGRYVDPNPAVVEEIVVKQDSPRRQPQVYEMMILQQKTAAEEAQEKEKTSPVTLHPTAEEAAGPRAGAAVPSEPSVTPPMPAEPPTVSPKSVDHSPVNEASQVPSAPVGPTASRPAAHPGPRSPGGMASRSPKGGNVAGQRHRVATSRPAAWPAQRRSTVIDWLDRPEEYDGTRAEAEAMVKHIQYMMSLLSERSRLELPAQKDPVLKASLTHENERLGLLLRAAKAAANGTLTPRERAAILAERKRLEELHRKDSRSRDELIDEFVREGRRDGPPPGKYPTTAAAGNVNLVPVDVNFP